MRTLPLIVAAILISFPAFAQDSTTGGNLPTNTAIPGLMLFTIGAVLVVAVIAFAVFLRKRSNRDATRRALGR